MNTMTKTVRRAAATWMTLALLSACGGGGGSSPMASAPAGSSGTGASTAGVGTGGTGAYVLGAISGFGSIIVNGVRYDDSAARVFDDDGQARSRDELRLGMTVELRGSAPMVDAQGVARATAAEVRFSRSLTGPITAVDAAAGSFVVFGQIVRVTSSTVFEGVAGLAALQAGQVVEVYAQPDAQGRQVATRIERKDAGSSSGASNAALRLTGTVASLSADRLQFKLGAITIVLSSPLAANLGNGSEVRVVARATATEGTLTALAVQSRSSSLDGSVSSAEVEGYITAFASMASFSVNGVPVVTTASTRFDGLVANLKLGAKVEVEGTVSAGVITASRVEIESDDDDKGSSPGPGNGVFELKGTVGSLDAPAMRFVLRGLTVRWDANTRFRDGTAANLANGRLVEVKARRSADGTTLMATEIEFED